MGKKTAAALFTVIFLIMVFGLGILSLSGLADYYINDEIINNEWTSELGNKFETDISSTFYKKFSFVNLNGAIRKIIGQQQMNGVVKLNNGYLTEITEKCPDDDIDKFVSKIENLNDYLKNRGTALLYFSPPSTVNAYDPELPVGVEDFSNSNIDRLILGLRDAGVDTIDSREILHSEDINQYSMMYRTDHHWTTEAGFYAYRLLENYVKEKTGCEIDPNIADLKNYTVTTYENWHLGSRGQRTGIYFAGIDDFVLIDPNFDVTLVDPYGKTGSIHDHFFLRKYLETRDLTSRYTYDSVLGGSNFLGHFRNQDSKNDVKVMMITDSFAKAVNPYMIMQFAEVNTFYNGYVGDINPELIEAYDPDVVIMLYYPAVIKHDSGAFEFDF